MPAPRLWDEVCADWDDELITTEDIKILAALLFPSPLLGEVIEEIEVCDLCCV